VAVQRFDISEDSTRFVLLIGGEHAASQ
jgi:hypothetical protein